MRKSTTRHVMGVLMIVVGLMSFMLMPTSIQPGPILGMLQICGIPAMFVGLWLFLTD